ncbi:MAG: hypothetical protein V3R57_02200 [Candidatus Bathyarchaeia archaeon]
MSVEFKFEATEEENSVWATLSSGDVDDLRSFLMKVQDVGLPTVAGFKSRQVGFFEASVLQIWKLDDSDGFKDVVFGLVSLAFRDDFPFRASLCLTETGRACGPFREAGFANATTALWQNLVFCKGPVALDAVPTSPSPLPTPAAFGDALYEMVLAGQIDLSFDKR